MISISNNKGIVFTTPLPNEKYTPESKVNISWSFNRNIVFKDVNLYLYDNNNLVKIATNISYRTPYSYTIDKSVKEGEYSILLQCNSLQYGSEYYQSPKFKVIVNDTSGPQDGGTSGATGPQGGGPTGPQDSGKKYTTNDLAQFLIKNPKIEEGSTINLTPGYHGYPIIKYSVKKEIFIKGGSGVYVSGLTFIGASNVRVSGLDISRLNIPINNTDLKNVSSGVVFDINTTYCTVEDCLLYSTKANPDNLTQREWKSLVRCGIKITGRYNTVRRNNLTIGGFIHIDYGAHNSYVGYNTVQNTPSDVCNVRASNCVFEYNTVKNVYKVDGNHNDLCQNWGGSFNVFRGNTFITNENPNQPFLDKPGISDVQCLAKFDQNSTNILVENNLVLGSHPIGIWWLGTSDSIIRYNTVVQVGDKTWFSNRPPTIATWPGKSGSSGKNNQIYGNLCQTIECQDGVEVKDYNLLLKTGDFSKTFKNWRSHDLHLVKPIYSTAKAEPPKVDKDGKVRNLEKPCVGCYEF